MANKKDKRTGAAAADFLLRATDAGDAPIGIAKREIKAGETIIIHIGSNGYMQSDAIDFDMRKKR